MDLLSLFVIVVVIGLVFMFLWWRLDRIKLKEPFNNIGHVVIALLAVFALMCVLTGLVVLPQFRFR